MRRLARPASVGLATRPGGVAILLVVLSASLCLAAEPPLPPPASETGALPPAVEPVVQPPVEQPASAPAPEPLRVTLADCVRIALKANRGVQKAYLERTAQLFDLKVARRTFTPQGTLSGAVRADRSGVQPERTTVRGDAVQVEVTEAIPTGGSFSFAWGASVNTSSGTDEGQSLASWSVSFRQPLLRGGGIKAGTSTLFFAELAETSNVLSLQGTLMNVVTSVIVSFRGLILAERDLGIRRSALERGRELLEINRALIAAGRMADVELVQAQVSLKSQELGVVTAENSLDSARLSLLQLLALDKSTQIVPVEAVQPEGRPPTLAEALELAFENRPDYRQALLSLQSSERNLDLAKNSALWDLSAEAGVSNSAAGTGWSDAASASGLYTTSDAPWYGALRLGIPINDLSRKQSLIRARVDLERTRLDLADARDSVETDVRNAVRNAEIALRQLEIAREGRTLSAQQLEIEREKLRIGRSTNFQVVNFQNSLVDAETSELSATISYLDALTYLDQALGTTLATWRIEVKPTDTSPPELAPGAEQP